MIPFKTVMVSRAECVEVYSTTQIHSYGETDIPYGSDGLYVVYDPWCRDCYISFENEESFLCFLLTGIRCY